MKRDYRLYLEDILPLQLADFAAFILNRWQIIISKQVIKPYEKYFLEIVEPVVKNFRNIPSRIEKFEKEGREWHRET